MLKKILKNNAILIIQMAANSASLLILTPHILNNIKLEQYGLISATLSAIAIINTLILYGTNITGPILASRSETDVDDNTSIIKITALKLFVFTLTIPITTIATIKLSLPYETSLLIAICTFSSAINTNWFLQGKSKFFSSAAISLTGTITALITGLAFITPHSNNNFFFTSLTIAIPQTLFAICSFFIAYKFATNQKYTPEIFKSLRENSRIAFSQIVSSIYTTSGALIIFNLAQKSDAGIYGAISRFYEPIAAACVLINTAALPTLSSAYQRSKIEYKNLIEKVLITYFATTISISIFIIAFRRTIGNYIINESNLVAESLIVAFATLLPLSIFGPIITTHYSLSGSDKKILTLTTQSLLICVPAGVFGISLYGPAAWVYTLCASQAYILHKLLTELKKVNNDWQEY